MNRLSFILVLSLIFTISKCYESTFFGSTVGSFTTSIVDFPVSVSGLPSDLSNVSIIRVSVSITTSSPSSVFLSLISPSGKEVGLYYRGRILTSSFTNIVFRDDGNEFAAGHRGLNSGVLIPISRLNQFNGENPNGLWKLRARMSTGTSTLLSWSLFISDYCDYNPCLNGGRCDRNTLTCECSVNNEGRLCENSLNIIGNEFVVGTQQHVFLTDAGKDQSTLTVPNIPFNGDIQVRTFVTVPHTFLNDLIINLKNPESNFALLVDRNGASEWNTLINTEFNDNATLTISQAIDNGLVVPGLPQTYLKPLSGTLNSLGLSASGDWVLIGSDESSTDVGTFYNWSLHLSGPNACPNEILENSRFQFSVAGQTINGVCRPGFYGFTSRDCISVNGVAQWKDNISGNCFRCPSNSFAPLGSTSISECICNKGYGKDINGNCVEIFCTEETIDSITYLSTKSGKTFSLPCSRPNFIGYIQRTCSQNGDIPIWLDPIINCVCPTGFILNDNNDCEDINECLTSNGGCGIRQCFNTPGSRSCSCLPGYSLVSGICQDVNECLTSNGGCGTGNCTNTDGSRTCTCSNGFYYNGKACVDVNECDIKNGGCGEGSCQNSVGSYSCQCFPGFSLSQSNTCVDIDECQFNNGGCGVGTCTNTDGSRTCTCPNGYSFNGKTCVDIDECQSNNGGCGDGTCTNTDGSRTCTCPNGYSFDGSLCIDIDECQSNNGGCGLGGSCQNSVGSYSCQCLPGFSLFQSNTCVDIDECQFNNGGCSLNAKCNNTIGSRTCQCNSGYFGNGLTCSPNPCQPNLGFPLTQSGKTSTINNCLANQFGNKTRSCSLGVWSSITNNCRNCISGFISNPNSTTCSRGPRLTDMNSFRPFCQFFLDGDRVDSSLNNRNISTSTYQFVNFYNRANPTGNRALRINNGNGVTIRNIPSDGTFSIHMIINSITAKTSDILRILNSSNRLILRISITPAGRFNYFNSAGSLIGSSQLSIRTGYSHFVIFSYNSSRMTIFVDDSQRGTFSISIPNGIYSLNALNLFDGYLDEINVYDSATFSTNYLIASQRTKCLRSCPSGRRCYNTLTSTEVCGPI